MEKDHSNNHIVIYLIYRQYLVGMIHDLSMPFFRVAANK